jgi:hypothetical protein
MDLSPSCDAASHSATQKFPNILWNSKIHENPPLVPMLSQMNIQSLTDKLDQTTREIIAVRE